MFSLSLTLQFRVLADLLLGLVRLRLLRRLGAGCACTRRRFEFLFLDDHFPGSRLITTTTTTVHLVVVDIIELALFHHQPPKIVTLEGAEQEMAFGFGVAHFVQLGETTASAAWIVERVDNVAIGIHLDHQTIVLGGVVAHQVAHPDLVAETGEVITFANLADGLYHKSNGTLRTEVESTQQCMLRHLIEQRRIVLVATHEQTDQVRLALWIAGTLDVVRFAGQIVHPNSQLALVGALQVILVNGARGELIHQDGTLVRCPFKSIGEGQAGGLHRESTGFGVEAEQLSRLIELAHRVEAIL